MNAHSSPIAFAAKPLIERSVMTGAPCCIGNRICTPATASASTPCFVSTRTPVSRIVRSMSWYWRARAAFFEGQVVRHRAD